MIVGCFSHWLATKLKGISGSWLEKHQLQKNQMNIVATAEDMFGGHSSSQHKCLAKDVRQVQCVHKNSHPNHP